MDHLKEWPPKVFYFKDSLFANSEAARNLTTVPVDIPRATHLNNFWFSYSYVSPSYIKGGSTSPNIPIFAIHIPKPPHNGLHFPPFPKALDDLNHQVLLLSWWSACEPTRCDLFEGANNISSWKWWCECFGGLLSSRKVKYISPNEALDFWKWVSFFQGGISVLPRG